MTPKHSHSRRWRTKKSSWFGLFGLCPRWQCTPMECGRDPNLLQLSKLMALPLKYGWYTSMSQVLPQTEATTPGVKRSSAGCFRRCKRSSPCSLSLMVVPSIPWIFVSMVSMRFFPNMPRRTTDPEDDCAGDIGPLRLPGVVGGLLGVTAMAAVAAAALVRRLALATSSSVHAPGEGSREGASEPTAVDTDEEALLPQPPLGEGRDRAKGVEE
mmetsp:Transcript_164882/g.529206  ORF Transcript_164882/g.529206 Transcript_164882/m.529206 type:complete len:213 (+) Transcript_164882:1005-1643(+)